MNQITVDKIQLEFALKKNRDKHQQEYQVALAGWRELVREELERVTALFQREGKLDLTQINHLLPPASHTEDYLQALEMLKWHVGEQVFMDPETFQQYIQDNWQWRRQWATSNSGYLQKAAERR